MDRVGPDRFGPGRDPGGRSSGKRRARIPAWGKGGQGSQFAHPPGHAVQQRRQLLRARRGSRRQRPHRPLLSHHRHQRSPEEHDSRGPSGGKISTVNYDSHDPIEKVLHSFALDLNSNPTYSQILDQARGEKIEIIRQPKRGRHGSPSRPASSSAWKCTNARPGRTPWSTWTS